VVDNATLAQDLGSLMIKWIVCDVAPTRRDEFSRAQELWAVLRAEDGFVCQVGGWDEKSPGTAGVLAVWTNAEAYERFMRDHHDAIVRASGQLDTYRSVQVATGPSILEMRGDRNGIEVLLRAGVLRVADCVVLSGHEDHFKRVQEHLWLPGMAGVDGMLGGLFSQVGERRYLTITGWRDARSHERYAHDRVPALRATAGTAGDLLQIESHILSLVPAWTVRADGMILKR
jgi:hypothetical protein